MTCNFPNTPGLIDLNLPFLCVVYDLNDVSAKQICTFFQCCVRRGCARRAFIREDEHHIGRMFGTAHKEPITIFETELKFTTAEGSTSLEMIEARPLLQGDGQDACEILNHGL